MNTVESGLNQKEQTTLQRTPRETLHGQPYTSLIGVTNKWQGGLHRGGRGGSRPPNLSIGGASPPQL